MHRSRKLSALRRCLKGEGWGKGDEVSFFCPLPKPEGCGGEHHKQKLSINLSTDKWHCWVCGQGGYNLLRLMALGGREHPDYVDYAAEIEKPKDDVAKEYDKVRLPGEFRPLCHPWDALPSRQAIGYLTRRGITSDDILRYKLGFCSEGRYADRIIIPSFDEYGELNFFVGRTIWNRDGDLPYLSGKFDKNIIFNDLLIDWTRPVTLVEGPFDAIKAGPNAIPLQGKFLSHKLLDKIIAHKSQVVIALDNDALGDALKIAEQMIKYGLEPALVNLPKHIKDPGEITRERFDVYRNLALEKPISGLIDIVRIRTFHSGSSL